MTARDDLERLLTPAEVSELIGVPIKTLYRWSHLRQAGNDVGPELVKAGGHLRYQPSAIRAWLKSSTS